MSFVFDKLASPLFLNKRVKICFNPLFESISARASAEIFAGRGAIRIQPVLTTNNESFFEIREV